MASLEAAVHTPRELLTRLDERALELDRFLTALDPRAWRLRTAEYGWLVGEHVSFLTRLNTGVVAALDGPCRQTFRAIVDDAERSAPFSAERPATMLQRWRRSRRSLRDCLRLQHSGSTELLASSLEALCAHAAVLRRALGEAAA